MGRVWEPWRGRWARPALGEERGQALILAVGGRLRVAGGCPGAGGDRRRGERQGEGAAGRRPGCDLGRALDARRPVAAALAAAAGQRPAEPGAHGQAGLPGAGTGRGGRRRPRQRRRPGAAAGGLPGRCLLRPDPGQGHGPRPARGRGRGRGGSVGGRRSGGADGRRRRPERDGERRRLQRPADIPRRRGHEARCRCRVRPHGGGGPRRRRLAAGRLRLPLRRRTGGTVCRPPGPDLGGPARPLAAPLRHRARPRSRLRLWLARGQRRSLRLRPALQLGGLALRLRRRPATLLGGRQRGHAEPGERAPRPAARPCPPSSPPASGRRCWTPPPTGTCPPPCSRRS